MHMQIYFSFSVSWALSQILHTLILMSLILKKIARMYVCIVFGNGLDVEECKKNVKIKKNMFFKGGKILSLFHIVQVRPKYQLYWNHKLCCRPRRLYGKHLLCITHISPLNWLQTSSVLIQSFNYFPQHSWNSYFNISSAHPPGILHVRCFT